VQYTTCLDQELKRYTRFSKKTPMYILHDSQKPSVPFFEFDSTRLQKAMDVARVQKCPHEVSLIRKANEISASAHRAVLGSIFGMRNEAQIEAIFLATCIGKQAKEQAYGVIAASGTNASTLHYVDNNQSLVDGRQLVCLDAGCNWDCYASDVTRSFPISGQWTKEGKQIHDLVTEMQDSCIEAIKPGVRFLDLHIKAHKIAVKGLLDIGILRGKEDEIYEAGTSLAFFPHGLGHHLGLEVHDVSGEEHILSLMEGERCPVVPTNGNYGVVDGKIKGLQAGMVVTVEPGM
jgi:Xaa-Pro aminopeptidase